MHDRGYLTFAQNSKDDYLRMAYALALSLKLTQSEVSNLSVAVTPGQKIPAKYREVFDHVIEIPNRDLAAKSSWKLENEWKAFHITPYQQTVKLGADMLFFSDVSEWWQTFKGLDFLPTIQVQTHRGELTNSLHYRKTFKESGLPNLYSDFVFFKQSKMALEFYLMVEAIFRNWKQFFMEFLDGWNRPTYVSTDVVYALAAKILDLKLSNISTPTFTHMKPEIIGMNSQSFWTEFLRVDFTKDCECKIGNYRQTLPLHYHEKWFLTDSMIEKYERKLGV